MTLVSSFQGNQDTQNFCDIDSYIKSSKDGQFKVSSDIVSEVQYLHQLIGESDVIYYVEGDTSGRVVARIPSNIQDGELWKNSGF